MARVIIIDDAIFMQKVIEKLISGQGHEVVGKAGNGDDGIKLFKELNPDLIIMDVSMPGKNGIEAIKEIIEYDGNARILICSAIGQDLIVMEGLSIGALDFISKPFEKEVFIHKIQSTLSKK